MTMTVLIRRYPGAQLEAVDKAFWGIGMPMVCLGYNTTPELDTRLQIGYELWVLLLEEAVSLLRKDHPEYTFGLTYFDFSTDHITACIGPLPSLTP